MHWTIRIFTLVAALTATLGTAAAAEPSSEADSQAVRDHDRAIEIASEDRFVQDRLALRSGLVPDAQPRLEDTGGAPEWLVTWAEPDDEDEPLLVVSVSLEDGRVIRASGLGLNVMPGRDDLIDPWLQSPWSWGVLCLGFAACVAGTFRRGDGARMLVPLAFISAAFVFTLLNVVPSSIVFEGNIALFAIGLVALLVGAVMWTRRTGRSAPRFEPRWSPFAWAAVWAAGLAVQVVGVLRVHLPIDVALASSMGARLMQGGVPVYGNVLDLPGLVTHGDTYGPIAYLPYVPAVALSEDSIAAVLVANLVMSVLVGVLLFVVGLRGGSATRGLWAAAAWTTCPMVAIGVYAGNNDIVVALTVLLLLMVLSRPVWRGALVAVAASTKFLPALLAIALLRLRGETRRDTLRYVASGIVTVLVIFAIALHGIDALDDFLDRTVGYQSGRLGIRSFWGLTRMEDARYVCMAAAALLAIYHAIRWRQLRPNVAAGAIASILALLIASLPQYWGVYGTWLVPPVLVAMLWRGQETAGDEDQSSTHKGSVIAPVNSPDELLANA